jgi:hypothetical protein
MRRPHWGTLSTSAAGRARHGTARHGTARHGRDGTGREHHSFRSTTRLSMSILGGGGLESTNMSRRQVASDATPQPHRKVHGRTVPSTKDHRERVPSCTPLLQRNRFATSRLLTRTGAVTSIARHGLVNTDLSSRHGAACPMTER